MVSLQRAIEEAHLNLTRVDMKFEDGKFTESRMNDDAKFWKHKKNWWESAPKEKEKEKAKDKKVGWWNESPFDKKDGSKKDSDKKEGNDKKESSENCIFLQSTWSVSNSGKRRY